MTHSAKARLRRDDGGAALVPIGEQIEEQLAAGAVEGHEAQLVDDEDVDAEQPLLQARELAGVAGFEELAHQVGRAGEEHAAFLFRRFDAERDGEMRLAGADRPREDQILGRRDPLAARERVDLRRVDAVGGGEVEGVERLHLGEARLAEALADDRLMPRRLLGTEDLVQIVLVRPMGIPRLPGQAAQTCAPRRAT